MKAYTQFVIKMFECLSELYQADEKRMKIIFSEGKDFLTYSHHQEYSVLQNEYARLFVSVIQSHAELFHINNQQYQLEQSGIFSDEVKIIHSCYPKNLRRWLSGTVGRRKCRTEFCVLVWCHAIGWNGASDCPKNRLEKCRERMRMICMEYLPDWRESADFSIEMLWAAANAAYQASLL